MPIRTKIYAAIVLAVLGPLVTVAVALYGFGQIADRAEEAQRRAERRALALQLKLGVTDVNGWQTAWGYDRGRSRPRFRASVTSLQRDLALARRTLDDRRERALLDRIESRLAAFLALDRTAYAALRGGRPGRTRAILLGPEIESFEQMATAAQALATYEAVESERSERASADQRRVSRRRLVAVALGAGLVVVLLLVTANDVARMALEGERRRRETGP